MVVLHVAAPNESRVCYAFLLVLSKYATVLLISCSVKVSGLFWETNFYGVF